MHPRFVPVVSSTIAGYFYRSEQELLLIAFKSSGATYAYERVSPAVCQGLAAAGSKGGFFREYIRERYATRRLDETEVAALVGAVGASPRRRKETASLVTLLQRYPILDVLF